MRKRGKDNNGNICKTVFYRTGAVFAWENVGVTGKRKMTDHFCLAWAFLAVLIGLAGILLQPSQIEHYISWRGMILGMIVLVGIIGSLWFLSMQVSILMRKNQELAMQTSLLNQDYMTLIRRVEELEKQNG